MHLLHRGADILWGQSARQDHATAALDSLGRKGPIESGSRASRFARDITVQQPGFAGVSRGGLQGIAIANAKSFYDLLPEPAAELGRLLAVELQGVQPAFLDHTADVQ